MLGGRDLWFSQWGEAPLQDSGEIDLHQTSLRWDDEDFDNSSILEELIEDASSAGKTLKSRRPGTIYVGTCVAHAGGHVHWDFVPGVRFYGLPGFDGSVITVYGHTPSGNRKRQEPGSASPISTLSIRRTSGHLPGRTFAASMVFSTAIAA
jgi:hypothetical protein